ncbi:HAMP domain-containing methyl-accepting chemotaxis protein [Peribacillus sp. FSL H8-0477]|uniref:methyl-accepting chemotaxis protein n=1 Tax=Peribacillus sp. FSL H8-0477 TaxID=2921388 RepID=UPI0030F61E6E
MGEKKTHYKFGLRKKLVLFITALALITYTTSALCIYLVYPLFFSEWNETAFAFGTLLLGIIWSSVLAFFAAGLIINPLRRLEKVALKAAVGDIREDVDVSKTDDEIRALGKAFNLMLANLREMVNTIDENFTETNEKVIHISSKSSHAAEQAETIYRTIEEISQGADSSAVSIQNTAESVEDVIRIAQEVQRKANSSAETSHVMVSELEKSKDVINSLVSGIQLLAEENRESLQAVKSLEENAKKVERIIQLVGDIAGQTNLLALNASIEAARAGEHGKGFAVVAEEVRKLADESANAVKGISDLIQTIQSDVQGMVQQISDQVTSANQEAKKGAETNAAIEEVTIAVHHVVNDVREITQLVSRQMDSIHETSHQSQEVAAIAEETSAGAEEVTSATQEQTQVIEQVDQLVHELKGQADKLKQTIVRFQV